MEEWLDFELHDDPETLTAALAMIDALADDSPSSVGDADASSTIQVGSIPSLLPEEEDVTDDAGSGSGSASASASAHSHDEASDGQATPKDTTNLQEPAPANDAALPSPPARRRVASTTQTRRRAEIAFLQDKVSQLEQSLATLKRRRMDDDDVRASADRIQDWQRVAARNSHARRVAQLENAQMRATLRSQVQVGRELVQILQRKSIDDDGQTISSTTTGASTGLSVLSASTTMMEPRKDDDTELLAQLDTLLGEADGAAFSNPQFADASNQYVFRDVQLQDVDASGTAVEFLVSWTLPFPTEWILDAIWATMARKMASKKCEMRDVTGLDLPENTMIALFRGSTDKDVPVTHPSVIRGKLMARRCYEQGQPTAKMATTVHADLFRGTDDLQFIEDVTTRIIPVPNASPGAVKTTAGRTDVLNCVQMRRRVHVACLTDHLSTHRYKAGIVSEFVLTVIAEEIRWKQQIITDLLYIRAAAVAPPLHAHV